jgi:thiamine-phosphate pyrophosphorylase
LATARLYVLVDGCRDAGEFARRLDRLLEAPVPLIQLRAKTLTDRELLDRAYLARLRTRDAGTLLIINDRADIAALVDADGVHVGQEELPVNAARRILGPGKLVGVSTHNHQQLLDALRDGADYVGCGPTYPSTTKEFQEFTGLEFLSQVAQATNLPAFAIGGLTLERLDEVLATGLHRVAVQSAIWNAPDPATIAQAFLARLAMH